MDEAIIRAEGLGKRYRIGGRRAAYATLRESLTGAVAGALRRARGLFTGAAPGQGTEDFWALREVCFEVRRGEVLGIIGRNGAGKSTLLKILSRITEPTEGRAVLAGRVGSLLEIGTGFHPELTGRENIHLSGAILGMKRAEIARKFDEIVAFAGVEQFLETPVKHYSSGMYVRLGFAVAAHLDPEILLIDEVLAVGDAEFQKKCLGKMGEVARGGRTVLFVSHNLAAVSALCGRAMLLSGGRIVFEGGTKACVDRYRSELLVASEVTSLRGCHLRQGDGRLKFTNFQILDAQGHEVKAAVCGEKISLGLDYESMGGKELSKVHISVVLCGPYGDMLIWCSSQAASGSFKVIPAQGRILCHFERFPLTPGLYPFRLFAAVGGVIADWVHDPGAIPVDSGDFFGTGKLPVDSACVLVPHTWEVVGLPEKAGVADGSR